MRRVVAVYREGRDVVDVRGEAFAADGSGMLPVRARAVRVSGLARVLTPPQRPRSATVPAVVAGASVFFLAVLVRGSSMDGEAAGRWPAFVGLSIVAAAAGFVAWTRRNNAGCGVVVDRARRLWQDCWYCRRCGFVSLMTTTGVSRVLAAKGLAASLIRIAGELRWHPATARD
ncbi:hypothetical protein [Actinoplanes sp. HUAS TT8]|uniref:hypothetical protein n=1 Tax=Actinoplanes sp. HUAS TT8 TaxID=3447453 RepID=UPI003F522299